MTRILVAIDGSEASRRAVRRAAELAHAFHARLTLAHTAPPPTPWDPGEELVDAVEFQETYERYAERLLDAYRSMPELRGLTVDTLLLHGSTAEAIADAAEASDVGMVAIGSRGLGAVSRVLLGSVSDRLVHICPKPLLVVH
ncbi:MAG: universal stress protein [Myxococcota bacterium]